MSFLPAAAKKLTSEPLVSGSEYEPLILPIQFIKSVIAGAAKTSPAISAITISTIISFLKTVFLSLYDYT